MDQFSPISPSEPINLVTVADFDLGDLRVQPSLRRVSAGGCEESVEPRVMQALVVLAQARGRVVSRDSLIDLCWGGRIVGEDAINRCIAKVRRLAETVQPPAFSIETIPKVGYLLKARQGDAAPGLPAGAPPAVEAAPAATDCQPADEPQDQLRLPIWRQFRVIALVAVLTVAGLVASRFAAPVARPPAGSAPFNPPSHSVAVLVLANLSGDPSQDYLSDGLSEALIDLLSRVNELRVTARTSSFYFKGKAVTIGQIASALNVASILEGSLRRQGTHLRIDVTLVDARTGFQLWSHSYDRSADDLLKLQDEIARSTAEALRVKLIDTDAEGLNQGGTTNTLAFDAYLRGEQHIEATIGDEKEQALVEFRRATALDPDFALAQSALAFVLVMIAQDSALDKTYHAMMDEARRAADLAVARAPGLGLAHAQRAMVLRNEVTDMSAAWAEAKTARALTPGNAVVEQTYAIMARAVGDMDEAEKAAQLAVDLDPLRGTLWWTLGRVLECAQRYDRARDAYQRSVDLLSRPPSGAPSVFAGLLLEQANLRSARPLCEKLGSPGVLQCLAIVDHALGRQQDAEADLAGLRAKTGDEVPVAYAEVYAQWHQPAPALQWLRKARAINDPDLRELRCEHWLDPIRGDPGFRDIEASLHFPPP
jgi:TolB-like protein/DNA-binding winged helix-turn-helix (wHTH) protein/Flp pilus assembly protein TadD